MSSSQTVMSETTNSNPLYGIKGWLILVAIGVTLAPLRMAFVYFPLYYDIFASGTYTALTTFDHPAYHPYWGPLIISETFYNALILGLSVWLVFLFYRKDYRFPSVFIGLAIANLIFIPLDAWIVSLIVVDEPIFDPDTMQEFIRSIVTVCVWCPYMLLSQRVKVTFAKPSFSEPSISAPKIHLKTSAE
ncbi:DUF2569 domain-containing protein [Alteromonas facilis]|uniref:DUF2569 domain-containing protein n=1 Tax=Alteromonas facilis TaxID=2048004 RepID=UPI000C28AAAC|nr:DUF2569 domain-containing protein [Alteromonas facilis]